MYENENNSQHVAFIQRTFKLSEGSVLVTDEPIIIKNRFVHRWCCPWVPDSSGTEKALVLGAYQSRIGAEYEYTKSKNGLVYYYQGWDQYISFGNIIMIYQKRCIGMNTNISLCRIVIRHMEPKNLSSNLVNKMNELQMQIK